MIDALEIWSEIISWDSCEKAINFYRASKFNNYQVLKQGSVDFDKPVSKDEEEDALYRALYYASSDGYMDMHIKQNQIAMHKYLKNIDASGNILVIDFGCGPMTAGLVFAELLSEINPDYKDTVFYHGIDSSQNMCQLSRRINTEFRIFDEERFRITTSNKLPSLPLQKDSAPFDIVILFFSYVLSPYTLKTDLSLNTDAEEQDSIMKDFAKKWHVLAQEYQESYVIYGNPRKPFLRKNWNVFSKELTELFNKSEINYNDSGLMVCDWGGVNLSEMACIKSERRE